MPFNYHGAYLRYAASILNAKKLSWKPLANGIRRPPVLIFETVGISRDSLSLCCSVRNCSQFLPTTGAFGQIKAPKPVWNFFPLCSISRVSKNG
jgi:hypothetical protein